VSELIPLVINPSTTPPFQTTVALDSASFSLSVTWNIAGQRWYATIQDQFANLVWNGPLIGSPLIYDIPLAPGIFSKSTILWREDTGNFEISP